MTVYRKTIIERTVKVMDVEADSAQEAEEKLQNSAIADFLVDEWGLDYEEGEPLHVKQEGERP